MPQARLHATAPPWWAWRARLRRWWQARLPRTDQLLLTQRNIYILPTRAGSALALTLVLLLIGSINYQLNLGYVLSFLLAGSAAAGMVVGHGVLRGLRLQLLPPPALFAGQQARLQVRLSNARRAPRLAIGLALQDAGPRPAWAWADVPGQGEATLEVGFAAERRGLHPVPVLRIETRFPLGSFCVWSVWRPAAQVLVYPPPEPQPPALPLGEPRAGASLGTSARAGGDFDGVRAYRRGDPLKLIVWKKFAKSGELLSRDTEHMQRQALWLDFARTGLPGTEARLSRLCAWVLAADSLGLDYGLQLPGQEVPVDSGSAQRQRCLHALATFGQTEARP